MWSFEGFFFCFPQPSQYSHICGIKRDIRGIKGVCVQSVAAIYLSFFAKVARFVMGKK